MRQGKLAVVATPIGNLADLSPRAAEVLRAADIVLCEDTRHSKPLLDRVGSRARLVSCHAHNERERKELVVEALGRGERVALVSDAGAPALSDPGGRLVEEVVGAGFDVEVLPGPSALTAALMGAGIDLSRFAFLGFLPKSGRPRAALLEGAERAGLGIVLYEAPKRVEGTLADLFTALGARRVVVARELTKIHETFHRGILGGALEPPFVEKGEVVILVEGGEPRAAASDGDVEAMLQDERLPPKERARRVAQALGIPVKEAYARVLAAGPATPEACLERALELLAQAAASLRDAEGAARMARGEPPLHPRATPATSDIPGADILMDLLSRGTSLRAPVEAQDVARQLLATLSALDALLDALGFEKEGRR
jgi:16S rRNA (cytidine1402-2'-O)-methyltransferase